MHIADIILAFFFAASACLLDASHPQTGTRPNRRGAIAPLEQIRHGKSQAYTTNRKNYRTGCLNYKAKLRLTGMDQPVETRFTLILGPVTETANRVKKPRLAPWTLEAKQHNGRVPQAMILAKLERLLYLAGPAPQTRMENILLRYAGKACRVWSVTVPPDMKVYAYLAEVTPGILALSYLSGYFPQGDVQSAEVQLESFHINKNATPAESGHNLLITLGKRPLEPETRESDDPMIVE